MRVNPEFSAIT